MIQFQLPKDNYDQFPIGKHLYNFQKRTSVLQAKHFDDIRNVSYNYQLNFYREKLKEKALHECCPEYINQAKEFLKKKIVISKRLTIYQWRHHI